MTGRGAPWHQASFRHVLVDMHIPDWDSGFLEKYEPERVADCVASAEVGAAMIYFQSHVGLCYWPTKSGKQHASFAGRDVAAENLEQFHARGIPVCAYYSVNFNNWAYLKHPEWRLSPAVEAPLGGGLLPAPRYGLCCLNNPGYRAFVREQTAEIVETYKIDAMFFDMVWWQSICLCDHCHERYRAECGAVIPRTIDWFDQNWCAFQAARERWLTEFAHELRANVHKVRPDIVVYHNFATAMMNWMKAVSFESARAHDFLGGDFYGGREEQLVVSRLMLNLSESGPVEFMTTVAANLAEHERLQSIEELELKTLAATSCSASFLMIAAINPDGTPNKEAFRRIGETYRRTEKYEAHLGGKPVEDIAVYFSSESKMNFAENGLRFEDLPRTGAAHYPHFEAVRGACSKLQAAHLPFGVITRRQLASLSDYKVIILPNVLRMDSAEVEAFREYVRGGGKLYASRETSLTESNGTRHTDFMLADLYGCHYQQSEDGPIIYLKAADTALKNMMSEGPLVGHWLDVGGLSGAVRLAPHASGKALASLALPYGYPHGGAVGEENWASIHSSPPWNEVDAPTIIDNDFGAGRVIYMAADIETAQSRSHEDLFVGLVRSLLDEPPSFEADIHPAVWMTAFDQRDRKRIIISFLNYQAELPVIPITDASFRVRAPKGFSFTKLTDLTEGTEISFEQTSADTLYGNLPRLDAFRMFAADYE